MWTSFYFWLAGGWFTVGYTLPKDVGFFDAFITMLIWPLVLGKYLAG